jgi:cytochrome c oxidase cbb3-type subunit III
MSDSKNKTQLDVLPDEKHLLLDHNYDGIHELNHPLPSWWSFAFYAGIVFAIIYFVYYQFLGGPTLREEFEKNYALVKAKQDEYKKLHGGWDPNQFAAWNNPSGISAGMQVYTDNCLQCHMEDGRGDVGPNLTDDHWLISKGTPETNYTVVYDGSEENGMPAWGDVLTTEEIYQVLAYIQTFKNTFHKDGKEPQGEKVED